MPSMANESNIPWLNNSKADISLSTDSIFNLQDDEVKQLMKDEHQSITTQAKLTTKEAAIPEIGQLISFIS